MQENLALLTIFPQVLVLDPQLIGLSVGSFQLVLELADSKQKLFFLLLEHPCTLQLIDGSILVVYELIELARKSRYLFLCRCQLALVLPQPTIHNLNLLFQT